MACDQEKTEFNARAKASMVEYLNSLTWEEKVRSIERMNEMGIKARAAMREALAREAAGGTIKPEAKSPELDGKTALHS